MCAVLWQSGEYRVYSVKQNGSKIRACQTTCQLLNLRHAGTPCSSFSAGICFRIVLFYLSVIGLLV